MRNTGAEPTLIEFSSWLRDPPERADRILDVAESNGVIEGLPPLTNDARDRLWRFLEEDASLAPVQPE